VKQNRHSDLIARPIAAFDVHMRIDIMINRSKIAATFLATTGLIAFSAPAWAGVYESAPNRDIDLCVSEIRQNADYTGASRVRHDVESEKRRSMGYSLKIDTTVYSDIDGQAIREYKAVCVVTGGKKPLRFTIEKAGDNS
jgi:hypothetical protein